MTSGFKKFGRFIFEPYKNLIGKDFTSFSNSPLNTQNFSRILNIKGKPLAPNYCELLSAHFYMSEFSLYKFFLHFSLDSLEERKRFFALVVSTKEKKSTNGNYLREKGQEEIIMSTLKGRNDR